MEILAKIVDNVLASLEHAKRSPTFSGDLVIIVDIVIEYAWYCVYIKIQ